MEPIRYVEQLKQQMESMGAGIELLSTPIFEQESIVEKVQLTIHFVSGSPQFEYAAYRDFKLRIEQQFGEQINLVPYLADNLRMAYEFVEQIQNLLPGKAHANFSIDKIKETNFRKDEPIYVVLVERKIYSYI